MDNYFQNIFPKIFGSQEDNQISIFGCPHSFFGRRGHEDTRILLPWGLNILKALPACLPGAGKIGVWAGESWGMPARMGRQKFCNNYIFFLEFRKNTNMGQVHFMVRRAKLDAQLPMSLIHSFTEENSFKSL